MEPFEIAHNLRRLIMSFYNNGPHDGLLSSIDQGIYEESSTQKAPLGTRLVLDDGRVFRYGYILSAVNRGVLVAQDVSATCVVDTDNVMTAAAVNATTVDITLASVTANQYQGGYLHTTDDTGEGYTYRIKSNDATGGDAGTGKVRFTLYDGLVAAVDTSTDFAITGNMYNTLIIANAATDGLVAGVTPISFTATYYGWIQTWGVCTVLDDGGVTAEHMLTLSDGTDGAVQDQDAYTEPVVGYSLFAGDSGGHVGVFLQIAP
jgi:hypothetical protein